MLLWTNEWFLQASAVLSPSASAVAYLDDMSVASERRADISAAIGLTSEFLRRWDVVLNREKTSVSLTEAARREWGLDFGGIVNAQSWDFLGTCLGTHKDSPKTRNRIQLAEQRLKRIATWGGAGMRRRS